MCSFFYGKVQLSFLQTDSPTGKTYRSTVPLETEESSSSTSAKVLVVGCAAVDISAQSNDVARAAGLHSTSAGTVTMGLGGVGRSAEVECNVSSVLMRHFGQKYCRSMP